MDIDIEPARVSAEHRARHAIDMHRTMPAQVFVDTWSQFYFCPSDRIFRATFIDAIVATLYTEGAASCCLLNLRSNASTRFFIERTSTGPEYVSFLQAGGPSTAWLFSMDRYVCSSNVGAWCLYCERENDVAVLALRSHERMLPLVEQLGALPIDALVEKASPPFPFAHLTPEWRAQLATHYGRGSGV